MHTKEDMCHFSCPWEYLNTEMPLDKFLVFKIEGEFMDIIYKVNPKQKKNVCVENGLKVLYLHFWNTYMDAWSTR